MADKALVVSVPPDALLVKLIDTEQTMPALQFYGAIYVPRWGDLVVTLPLASTPPSVLLLGPAS